MISHHSLVYSALWICWHEWIIYVLSFFFDEWKNACGQTAFYISQNDCQNVSSSIIQAITKCHCDDFRRPSELNAPATSDKINEYYLRVLPTRFSSRRQFDLFNISHTIRAVAPRNLLLLLHFRLYISKFRANTFANQLTRLWHSANRHETYMWNSMFERTQQMIARVSSRKKRYWQTAVLHRRCRLLL